MSLLQNFLSFQHHKQVNALAVELAKRSWPRIWERVQGRAASMTLAEARGYVRAHSAPIVQEMVTAALRNQPALESQRAAIVERTTDEVLEQATAEIHRVLRNHPAARPAARAA